jgi:hypothetical protein
VGNRHNLRRGVAACVPAALLAWSMGAAPAVASAQTITPATTDRAATAARHLTSLGSVNLRQLAAQAPATVGTTDAILRSRVDRARSIAATTVPVPNPAVTAIAGGRGGAHGFVGITDATQSQAKGNFSLEPPDQGLCAHAGVVLEAVNLGVQAYTETGHSLTGVISLNAFFHLPLGVIAGTPTTFGPFLSDPRCYFDAQTSRWFVSVLEIDVNPYTGAFGYRSATLLAVSQTADPTGSYGLFSIDSTNDGTNGTPAEANCPCFGDQPRLGADANGIYVTTDSYPIHGVFNSNGGELYALSKSGLAAAATGGATPTLVDIHSGSVIVDGFPSNALQPATTPAGAAYAANTEYLLNTPDFNGFATSGGVGAQAVVLWALGGTGTLATASPSLTLSHAILPSEPYAPPVAATQKKGPIPYGKSIGATAVPPLSVNDDRMQQVEYVNGHVFSSLNTGIGPAKAADRSGVAWFVVAPTTTGGSVASQGYVAIGSGATLLYPAIGLDASGQGVMTFSLSGPGNFPSAAFMRFSGTSPTGPINAIAHGTAPEDGFTCYTQAGFGPACRWGDYSAASSDGAGHIVMGDEMIPNRPRAVDGNWGTFISVVSAH